MRGHERRNFSLGRNKMEIPPDSLVCSSFLDLTTSFLRPSLLGKTLNWLVIHVIVDCLKSGNWQSSNRFRSNCRCFCLLAFSLSQPGYFSTFHYHTSRRIFSSFSLNPSEQSTTRRVKRENRKSIAIFVTLLSTLLSTLNNHVGAVGEIFHSIFEIPRSEAKWKIYINMSKGEATHGREREWLLRVTIVLWSGSWARNDVGKSVKKETIKFQINEYTGNSIESCDVRRERFMSSYVLWCRRACSLCLFYPSSIGRLFTIRKWNENKNVHCLIVPIVLFCIPITLPPPYMLWWWLLWTRRKKKSRNVMNSSLRGEIIITTVIFRHTEISSRVREVYISSVTHNGALNSLSSVATVTTTPRRRRRVYRL